MNRFLYTFYVLLALSLLWLGVDMLKDQSFASRFEELDNEVQLSTE